jgi:hypothetical protein
MYRDSHCKNFAVGLLSLSITLVMKKSAVPPRIVVRFFLSLDLGMISVRPATSS